MATQKEIIANLNPHETIVKWIAALRSGEYKQGSGKLKIKTAEGVYEYCCLGVLYEICEIKSKIDTPATVDNGRTYEIYKFGMEIDYISTALAKKLNMTTGIGVPEKTEFDTEYLIEMNDEQSDGFESIADVIEKQILPKFDPITTKK